MDNTIKAIHETHADITEQSVISSAKFVTEEILPKLSEAGVSLSEGSLISIHSLSRIFESDNTGRKVADILIWSGMFSEFDADRLVCKTTTAVEETNEEPAHQVEPEVKEEPASKEVKEEAKSSEVKEAK
jgi:hypothetical protein|uniref:Uncharacterized protein n=1 Tax=Myoviridae sp. ctA4D8 TaxID=2823535 RepID=A0A8S5L6M1_9CAUD|nr:MAG TPA: hypothetical protein [Myoviridae sp. ctA4D8]